MSGHKGRARLRAARAKQRRAEVRALEAAAAAEQAQVRARRRSLIVNVTWPVIVVAGFTYISCVLTKNFGHWTVILAMASGLLIVAGVFAHRRLKRALGWLTAVAALALLSGAVMLTGAALSPSCPGSSAPGRCSTGELATWGMNGLLVPLAATAFIGFPILGFKTSRGVGRAIYRLWQFVDERLARRRRLTRKTR